MQSLQQVTSNTLDASDVSGEVSWTQDSQATILCEKQPERLRTGSNQVLVPRVHMHKLARGHIHIQSPGGIATTTPNQLNELIVKEVTQDTPQGSGETAFGNQEQYSHDCSDEPQNSWSDAAETQADKRRKMNRESARRTRVRKQQQMQSLESEVAQLKSEDVSKSECIRLLTKKVREMTSDTRRLHLEYQLLMKYVGELTATCRSKEAAVLELHNQIRRPEDNKHVVIPPAEQVEKKLSADSLRFLNSQNQRQGTSIPDGYPSMLQEVQSRFMSQSQAPSGLQQYMAGHQPPLDPSRPTPSPLQSICSEFARKPVAFQPHAGPTAPAYPWTDSHIPQATFSDPSSAHTKPSISVTSLSHDVSRRSSSLPPLGKEVLDMSHFFATHSDGHEQEWSAKGTQNFQARAQRVLQQQQQQRFGAGPPCKAAMFNTAPPVPTPPASQLQASAARVQDMQEHMLRSKECFPSDSLMQALGVEPEQRTDAASRPFKMARTKSHTFSQTAMQQMSELAQTSMAYGIS